MKKTKPETKKPGLTELYQKQAYQRFPDDMTLAEFYVQLNAPEIIAVTVINFIGNCSNGGFGQWDDRGHAKYEGLLRNALEVVGTETCKEVVGILDRRNARHKRREAGTCERCGYNHYEETEREERDEQEDSNDLGRLYDISEQFLADVDAYLLKAFTPNTDRDKLDICPFQDVCAEAGECMCPFACKKASEDRLEER